LIEVASQLIEKRCNRVFAAANYTEEKHNGSGDNSIFVFNPPINSLTALSIVTTENIVVDVDDLEYNSVTGEIRWQRYNRTGTVGLTVWPEGFQNILITYNGGFSSIPKPIELLCAEMVLNTFDTSGQFGGGFDSEKLGQYQYKTSVDTMNASLLAHKNIINLYKISQIEPRGC